MAAGDAPSGPHSDAHGKPGVGEGGGRPGQPLVDTSDFPEGGGAGMSSPGPEKWEFSMAFCPGRESESEAWTCGPGCAAGEGKGKAWATGRRQPTWCGRGASQG